MEVDRALGWLQATPVAKAISENEILFPWIEVCPCPGHRAGGRHDLDRRSAVIWRGFA